MVDIIRQIIRTHREVEVISPVDHIHADPKTQEDKTEIAIQTVQNNAISAEINTIRITCNFDRRKIKFFQNVPKEFILKKFADLQRQLFDPTG